MSRPEIRTVYIGDIINSADEDFLREIFGPPEYGKIISLTLNQKNIQIPNSKYAFIEYESQKDAQKVVDEMNYTSLDGYEIRVSLADPNFQKLRSKNDGNVTLRNLDESIDTKMLHEAFEQYGELISCKIPKGKNGEHFGVAYIQFKNPKDAQAAIEEMQGMTINGKEVTIEKFNPTDTSPNIYIKEGIPLEIDSTPDLKKFLNGLVPHQDDDSDNDDDEEENYGPFTKLSHASLLKLPDNPKYRQAYLTFTDIDSTKAAQDILEKAGLTCERVTNASKINHMKQNCAHWNQYKARDSEQRCLYVKNIPLQYTEEMLRDFFSQFGDVFKCSLKKSTDSSFAYVTFSASEGAKYALKKSTLACSHFNKKERKGSIYPTQLYVAAYTTRETKLKTTEKERAQIVNNDKRLYNRIIKDFTEDSMQYERYTQLSPEQKSYLIDDQDLYDDWADEANNQPYEDDFDDDEEEEEIIDTTQNSPYTYKNFHSRGGYKQRGSYNNYNYNGRGRGRGNFRPQRGHRGGRGNNYRPYRGGRGSYTSYNQNVFQDDYYSDDDDY